MTNVERARLLLAVAMGFMLAFSVGVLAGRL